MKHMISSRHQCWVKTKTSRRPEVLWMSNAHWHSNGKICHSCWRKAKRKFNNHQFKLRSLILIISIAFVITLTGSPKFPVKHCTFLIADKIVRNVYLPCSWCRNGVGSRPIAFSRFRYLARRFWNQTCNVIKDIRTCCIGTETGCLDLNDNAIKRCCWSKRTHWTLKFLRNSLWQILFLSFMSQ